MRQSKSPRSKAALSGQSASSSVTPRPFFHGSLRAAAAVKCSSDGMGSAPLRRWRAVEPEVIAGSLSNHHRMSHFHGNSISVRRLTPEHPAMKLNTILALLALVTSFAASSRAQCPLPEGLDLPGMACFGANTTNTARPRSKRSASAGATALPCGTPACAPPHGNLVRFTGYVDYTYDCGTTVSSFAGADPFHSIPVGMWTNPALFPGVEELGWNCNEAQYADCVGTVGLEYSYGVTTAGGYPAFSLNSATPSVPLSLTFLDQSNSAILPGAVPARNVRYRSDHILNLNL